MILRQVFKTHDGALRRATFENVHCHGKYTFVVVRFLNGSLKQDFEPFSENRYRNGQYHWRIERLTPGMLAERRRLEAIRLAASARQAGAQDAVRS